MIYEMIILRELMVRAVAISVDLIINWRETLG